jgi:hypothetical protein
VVGCIRWVRITPHKQAYFSSKKILIRLLLTFFCPFGHLLHRKVTEQHKFGSVEETKFESPNTEQTKARQLFKTNT